MINDDIFKELNTDLENIFIYGLSCLYNDHVQNFMNRELVELFIVALVSRLSKIQNIYDPRSDGVKIKSVEELKKILAQMNKAHLDIENLDIDLKSRANQYKRKPVPRVQEPPDMEMLKNLQKNLSNYRGMIKQFVGEIEGYLEDGEIEWDMDHQAVLNELNILNKCIRSF